MEGTRSARPPHPPPPKPPPREPEREAMELFIPEPPKTTPPVRGEGDAGTAGAVDAGTRGVTDTIPPNSNGSGDRRPIIDIPLGDDDGFLDRAPRVFNAALCFEEDESFFRDAVFNSQETVSYRDEEGLFVLVVRHVASRSRIDCISVMPSGARTHRTVLEDGPTALHATITRGPGGHLFVAWAHVSDKRGSVIEVVDLDSGAKASVGDPAKRNLQPQLVPGGEALEVVYLSDGTILRTRLNTTTTEELGQVESLLRVRRGPDGHLMFMATRADGHVTLGDRRFEGVAGDFVYTPSGALIIVIQRRGGEIHMIAGDETRVLVRGTPDTGPPVLVRTSSGMRLYYHEAATPTPRAGHKEGTFYRDWMDGIWGDERRVPQPEAVVTHAAVVVEFSAPWDEAQYKEMNTTVFVNDREVGRLRSCVPYGRYIFPVPVDALRYRGFGQATAEDNEVSLDIEGIGPGTFHVTDVCELYTQHVLIQEYLVARSEAEAQELAALSRPEVIHEGPDLVLACNDWQVPRDVKPGATLRAEVQLVNVGSAPAPAGTLVASSGGREVGRAPYVALRPFERTRVHVPLAIPSEWDRKTPLEVAITTDVPGDLRKENHKLSFALLREPNPEIAGPQGPARVEGSHMRDAVAIESMPFTVDLAHAAKWYRLKATEGKLQVKFDGVPEDAVFDVSLFSADGTRIQAKDGRFGVPGDTLYLHLSWPSGFEFDAESTLQVGWE